MWDYIHDIQMFGWQMLTLVLWRGGGGCCNPHDFYTSKIILWVGVWVCVWAVGVCVCMYGYAFRRALRYWAET